MKRFFALTMALLIAISLCACGGGGNTSGTGYIKRVGDKLYIKNHKDEVQELVKQG